jgi:uncharacterized FlgJ-related protein
VRPSSLPFGLFLSVWSVSLLSSCAAEAASNGENPAAADEAAAVGSATSEEDRPDLSTVQQDASDTIYARFETVEDIEAFFQDVEYSPDHWAAGVREVPRMYVTQVSERWQTRTTSELTVQAKKRIFFRAMAPLALRSNELIRAEREQLMALPEGVALSDEQRDWLAELAQAYGVTPPADGDGDGDGGAGAWDAVRVELSQRVDEVPVSLVLAQSANESGWGTSRFAAEGNALFGQWSFGGSGMLPQEQRASLGNYGVAAFESPLLSVISYMRNLNTHAAYAGLRDLRTQARANGELPRGHALAAGLDRYSERGQEYVDEIRSMIEFNGLEDTDETYLAPGPVYLVVPADDNP